MKADSLSEVARLVRFAIVGVVVTFVHLAIALVLAIGYDWPSQAANLAGFVAAVSLSFLGHHRWTFRSPLAYSIAARRFFIVAALGYAASVVVIAILQSVVGLPRQLALLLAGLAVPAASYVVNKLYVFR
jgi:putative flippase GtrA